MCCQVIHQGGVVDTSRESPPPRLHGAQSSGHVGRPPGRRSGGLDAMVPTCQLSIEFEIPVALPLADVQPEEIPFLPLGIDQVLEDMRAQGLADDLVLLHLGDGF